jgi:hypothetical protein
MQRLFASLPFQCGKATKSTPSKEPTPSSNQPHVVNEVTSCLTYAADARIREWKKKSAAPVGMTMVAWARGSEAGGPFVVGPIEGA